MGKPSQAKAFHDGDRFCLVVENCTPELKNQLLHLLNPEIIGEVCAMPVQKSESEQANPSVPLLTPEQMPSAATDAAFQRLAMDLVSGRITEGVKDVRDTLNQYLKVRFAGADPQKYVKMTPNQCQKFFDTFGTAIPQSLWDFFQLQGVNEFFAMPEENRGPVLAGIIQYFASLSQKKK